MSTPTKFRKKPVVIEAIQWTEGEEGYELADWCGGQFDEDISGGGGPNGEDWGELSIDTLEGTMTVSPLDYVIRGVKGEFYPCKPDVFAATYEVVV